MTLAGLLLYYHKTLGGPGQDPCFSMAPHGPGLGVYPWYTRTPRGPGHGEYSRACGHGVRGQRDVVSRPLYTPYAVQGYPGNGVPQP